MEIFDCTLRDGGHAVGGFSAKDAATITAGLLDSGVKAVEFGKASGIGSNKGTVSDEEYLEAVSPLFPRGEVGMFCRPEFFKAEQQSLVAEYRPGFLRVGTSAGKVEPSQPTIAVLRSMGIKVRYSLIQAHLLTPEQLAENGKKVADYGAQVLTIMDSTGTMLPDQVREYVSRLVDAVEVPVGFHGHNNLGLSIANGIAAFEAGAQSLDGALLGLARSAGNAPTEMLIAVLEHMGKAVEGIDLFRLLDFIETELQEIVPGSYGVQPLDISYGLAGFHSKNYNVVKSTADREKVNLFQLVVESAKTGEATITESIAMKAAEQLKKVTATKS